MNLKGIAAIFKNQKKVIIPKIASQEYGRYNSEHNDAHHNLISNLSGERQGPYDLLRSMLMEDY